MSRMGEIFWRRVALTRWIHERPEHSGLTATEIVDAIGGGLYGRHGRYDRCFDDLIALERIGEVKRDTGRPARWSAAPSPQATPGEAVGGARNQNETGGPASKQTTGRDGDVRFRKKPVEVDALLFDGNRDEIKAFLGDDFVRWGHGAALRVRTPEGVVTAVEGDWLIRGVAGEHYPCRPDIFEATYDSVEVAA